MPSNNLLVKDLILLIHWKTRLSGYCGKPCTPYRYNTYNRPTHNFIGQSPGSGN